MLAYVSLSFRLPRCHLTRLISSRVSIVNFRGNVILDTFVAPTMQVSDYRTSTTGIEACHLLARESISDILYSVGLILQIFIFILHQRSRHTFI